MNQRQRSGEPARTGDSQRSILRDHQMVSRVSRQKRLASILLRCAGLMVLSANHHAIGEIKFELEGPVHLRQADYRDGLSDSWSVIIGGEAAYDPERGELLVDRTGETIPPGGAPRAETYVELDETMLAEVSIRAVGIVKQPDFDPPTPGVPSDFGPAITLAARTCFVFEDHVCGGQESQWTYIDFYTTGEAHAAQSAGIGGAERIVQTDLRPMDEYVNLQLDAFGEDIQIRAWRAGEPMPVEPLIHFTAADQPETRPGGVMFGTIHADAWFRWVHVADTPIQDLRGDFNFDLQVNATDVDLLSKEIREGNDNPIFDLNEDEKVTAADRKLWVESEDIANTYFGDADLNGEVDFADFLALSDNFGQAGGWAEGDFDGSGDVQFPDFLLLSSNFGSVREATLAQSVPEPNASFLALACCLCLCGRRARIARGERAQNKREDTP